MLAQVSDDRLKQKFLCGDHFPQELLKSTKLPSGALPIDYAASSASTSLRKFEPRPSTSTSQSIQEEIEELVSQKSVKRKLFMPETVTPKRKKNLCT